MKKVSKYLNSYVESLTSANFTFQDRPIKLLIEQLLVINHPFLTSVRLCAKLGSFNFCYHNFNQSEIISLIKSSETKKLKSSKRKEKFDLKKYILGFM